MLEYNVRTNLDYDVSSSDDRLFLVGGCLGVCVCVCVVVVWVHTTNKFCIIHRMLLLLLLLLCLCVFYFTEKRKNTHYSYLYIYNLEDTRLIFNFKRLLTPPQQDPKISKGKRDNIEKRFRSHTQQIGKKSS